jgi:hypothetical protein
MMNFWEPKTLKKNQWYHWKIGPCRIWIRRSEDDEWSVAFDRTSMDQHLVVAQREKKPEDLSLTRYIFRSATDDIQFLPALPDRPVMVNPESPVNLLSKTKAIFFVSIPLWLRIYSGEKDDALLCEIPTEMLSNTWFGDPMEGELCYSLKTSALRSITDFEKKPHKIYCPVYILNNTSTPFQFQKLCIHVENLRVYRANRLLLTNDVEITFIGEELPSQIVLSDGKPSISGDSVMICEERIPTSKSLLKKSFSLLKCFTNY